MPNKYFTDSITLIALNRARSVDVEAKFQLVEAGFDGVLADFAAVNSTQAAGDVSDKPASTRFVSLYYVPKASPAFTGPLTVTGTGSFTGLLQAATPPSGDYSQNVVTTQYLKDWATAVASAGVSPVVSQTIGTDNTTLSSNGGYKSARVFAGAGTHLVLPDARTLSLGFYDELYLSAATSIIDQSGMLAFVISAAGNYRLWLIDNTTLRGTWAYTPAATMTTPGLTTKLVVGDGPSVTIFSGTNTSTVRAVQLDDLRVLVLFGYRNNTAADGLYAVVGTSNSDTGRPTLAFNTPAKISGGTNVGPVQYGFHAELVDTDKVAIAFTEYDGTNYTHKMAVVDSANVATPLVKDVQALHASGTTAPTAFFARVRKLNTAKFIVMYAEDATFKYYLRVIKYVAATGLMTMGAETLLYTGTAMAYADICQFDSNAGADTDATVVAIANTVSVRIYPVPVAGTTPTPGAAITSLNASATAQGTLAMCKVDVGAGVLCYETTSAGTLNTCGITYNGVTPVVGGVTSTTASSTRTLPYKIAPASTTLPSPKFIVSWGQSSGNVVASMIGTASGTALSGLAYTNLSASSTNDAVQTLVGTASGNYAIASSIGGATIINTSGATPSFQNLITGAAGTGVAITATTAMWSEATVVMNSGKFIHTIYATSTLVAAVGATSSYQVI